MRSRTPLMLIELMLLLLVFSFAAAVCMKAFVKSDEISAKSEARDYAVTVTQTAAEIIRHTGGDMEKTAEKLGAKAEDNALKAEYDSEWNTVEGEGVYSLHAENVPSQVRGLGQARVWTADSDGNELFALDVMWQEADTDA